MKQITSILIGAGLRGGYVYSQYALDHPDEFKVIAVAEPVSYTHLAFIAMTCAYIFFTGTTTLMILGNIMAVPEEVREAAMLDGASGLKQDWFITIPMIKGTLKTVSILAATSGFLLYNEVYFLTKGAAGTYSTVSYTHLNIPSPFYWRNRVER